MFMPEMYQNFEFSADLGAYPGWNGLSFRQFRHSAPHRSKV
jgi:hypothetical protein